MSLLDLAEIGARMAGDAAIATKPKRRPIGGFRAAVIVWDLLLLSAAGGTSWLIAYIVGFGRAAAVICLMTIPFIMGAGSLALAIGAPRYAPDDGLPVASQLARVGILMYVVIMALISVWVVFAALRGIAGFVDAIFM